MINGTKCHQAYHVCDSPIIALNKQENKKVGKVEEVNYETTALDCFSYSSYSCQGANIDWDFVKTTTVGCQEDIEVSPTMLSALSFSLPSFRWKSILTK